MPTPPGSITPTGSFAALIERLASPLISDADLTGELTHLASDTDSHLWVPVRVVTRVVTPSQ